MMNRILYLIGLTSVLALPGAHAATDDWSALLEPQALAALLENEPGPQLLRVSGDHSAGHIASSVRADYADFRGPADNPGSLPSIEALTRVVQSLGLDGTRPVVVIHDGDGPSDMGTATRVYWTLKSLGIPELAVLNGGFHAWRQAGLPVVEGPVAVAASDWAPRWHDDWRIGTDEIEQRLEQPAVRLVDARPGAFFDGSRSSIARPGTIRGAVSLGFDRWFDGDRMHSPDELRRMVNASPLPPASETVSFCNTGHWASINWFVLSEVARVPDTRLYAESMAEWSRTDRPMDNQPDRLAYYWDMTVDWFNGLWGH